jgi:hypothetical protein
VRSATATVAALADDRLALGADGRGGALEVFSGDRRASLARTTVAPRSTIVEIT